MSDDEEETSYRIRDPDKGLAGKAIIINVMNKSSKENYRIGSGNDVQKMQKVFEHLNLEVQRAQSDDPTAQEIKDGIIRFRDTLIEEYKNREEDFDMVAVCLMGHGEEGVIFGSDEQEVDLRNDVFQAFSNENCNVLSGKPRLFFIQACRGDKQDRGIDGQPTLKRLPTSKQFKQTRMIYNIILLFRDRGTDNPLQHAGARKRKAALDDTVRAYACLENYVAFRSQEGAQFIDCIHQVFMKHAKDDDIDKLLKGVKRIYQYCILIHILFVYIY